MKRIAKLLALVCCLSLVLCACNPSGAPEANMEDDMSKEVTLKWYIMAQTPTGSDEVLAKVNEYLKEKINAKLDLVFIQPGDYKQKTQMIMAANEEYDLMWMATGYNYRDNAAKGAFFDLDELLDKVPELKAFYPDSVWDATRIGGKIYGVPDNQVLYSQDGLWFNKAMTEKYGMTETIENAKSWDDVAKAYEAIKTNETDVIPLRSGNPNIFDNRKTVEIEGYTLGDDGKFFNKMPQDMPNYKKMREFYQKGYFPADVATMTDETSLIKAQKIYSRYSRQLPGVSGKFKIQNNYDVINIETNEPLLNRGGIQSTLTCVSSTSKNPVRALKLVNLMNTDKYLFNLMAYGIEGKNYVKDPNNENRIIREGEGITPYYVAEYLIGNQFLAYILPSYEDDVWEETDRMNKEAAVDPNIGFDFDPVPVQSELSQINAVKAEYDGVVTNGLEDPEVSIPAYMEKRKTAGEEKVIAELQRQYDEWKKAQ